VGVTFLNSWMGTSHSFVMNKWASHSLTREWGWAHLLVMNKWKSHSLNHGRVHVTFLDFKSTLFSLTRESGLSHSLVMNGQNSHSLTREWWSSHSWTRPSVCFNIRVSHPHKSAASSCRSRVLDYRSRGPGFDSRALQKKVVCLERGVGLHSLSIRYIRRQDIPSRAAAINLFFVPTWKKFQSSEAFLKYLSIDVFSEYRILCHDFWSQDNSVGIVTGYGLGGWGLGVRIPVRFRAFLPYTSFRPALGPTQTSVEYILGHSSTRVKLTTNLKLAPRSKVISSTPPYVFIA
jgi:hypothetical protein